MSKPIYVLGIHAGLEPPSDNEAVLKQTLLRKFQLPWKVADDPEFKELWAISKDNQEGWSDEELAAEGAKRFTGDTIEDQGTLLAFLEDSDTDESDWFLVKFGADGPEMLTSARAHYRSGIEEDGE